MNLYIFKNRKHHNHSPYPQNILVQEFTIRMCGIQNCFFFFFFQISHIIRSTIHFPVIIQCFQFNPIFLSPKLDDFKISNDLMLTDLIFFAQFYCPPNLLASMQRNLITQKLNDPTKFSLFKIKRLSNNISHQLTTSQGEITLPIKYDDSTIK